jgi:hypothetical protein
MEPLFPKPSPFWKAEYASPQDATQKETPGGVHPEPGEEVIVPLISKKLYRSILFFKISVSKPRISKVKLADRGAAAGTGDDEYFAIRC